MRIAIASDIHDNLTASHAVLSDLREISPDLILHGGDLVSGGSSPVEVVDRFAIWAGGASSAIRTKPSQGQKLWKNLLRSLPRRGHYGTRCAR
jgi:Calcineurin-like phosphoesterase superfamily domain